MKIMIGDCHCSKVKLRNMLFVCLFLWNMVFAITAQNHDKGKRFKCSNMLRNYD